MLSIADLLMGRNRFNCPSYWFFVHQLSRRDYDCSTATGCHIYVKVFQSNFCLITNGSNIQYTASCFMVYDKLYSASFLPSLDIVPSQHFEVRKGCK